MLIAVEQGPGKVRERGGKSSVWLVLVMACLIAGSVWVGSWRFETQRRTNLLFKALHQDNPAALLRVLNEGADPNVRQTLLGDTPTDLPGIIKQRFINALHPSGSETALTEAVQMGDPKMVRILLDHGASPNLRNSDGSTAILVSACVQNFQVQSYPLPNGVRDLISGKPSETQIRIGIMQMLLNRGADVNVEDHNGRTALEISAASVAANGRWDDDVDVTVPRFLLERGADVNVEVPIGDRDVPGFDASLLYTVAGSGDKSTALARLLLDHGADVNAVSSNRSTPLALASERTEPVMMKMLLDHGADPNVHPGSDESPLMEAVNQGQKGIVQLLLDKGADVNEFSAGNGTPLTVAMRHKRADIVKLLLDRGANPNYTDKAEEVVPALVSAISDGDVQDVKFLLARGANPNLGDKFDTPLLAAVDGCLIEAYRKRHDNGFTIGDWAGVLPVTPPCGTTIPQMLLAAGADANKPNEYGDTALLYAVAGHNAPLVRLLLASGANPNPPGAMALTPDHSLLTPDKEMTPIGLATQRGYGDLIPLLRRSPHSSPPR